MVVAVTVREPVRASFDLPLPAPDGTDALRQVIGSGGQHARQLGLDHLAEHLRDVSINEMTDAEELIGRIFDLVRSKRGGHLVPVPPVRESRQRDSRVRTAAGLERDHRDPAVQPDLIVVVSDTDPLRMTVAGDLTGERHRAILNAVGTVDRLHRANPHVNDVVIELGRVRDVDAAGARALMEAALRLTADGRRVTLQGASLPLQTLLEAGEDAETSALLSSHTDSPHQRSGRKRS